MFYINVTLSPKANFTNNSAYKFQQNNTFSRTNAIFRQIIGLHCLKHFSQFLMTNTIFSFSCKYVTRNVWNFDLPLTYCSGHTRRKNCDYCPGLNVMTSVSQFVRSLTQKCPFKFLGFNSNYPCLCTFVANLLD